MAKHQDAGTTSPSLATNEDRLVQLKIRTARLEHASRRFGMLLKGLFGLFWLAALFATLAMAYRAHGSRGTVIDSFDVASSLAKEDMTGETVAGRIRGRLRAMRRQTSSSRAIDELKSDWIDDYRVEIPQTKITVSEFNNGLRRWLGNETRVGGEVFRAGDAMVLTLLAGGSTTTVEAGDFAGLVEKAAETIYEQTEPYLFATYLAGIHARRPESTSKLAALARSGVSVRERAWALNGLANNLIEFEGRCADALLILAAARQLGEDIPNIYGNLRNAHDCLGHEQQAADATAEELRRLPTRGHLLGPRGAMNLLSQDLDNLAGNYGDYRWRLKLRTLMERTGFGEQSLILAETMARLRDVRGSAAVLHRWHAIQRGQGPFTPPEQAAYWNARFAQAWAMENWRDAVRFAEKIRFVNGRRTDYPEFFLADLSTHTTPLEAIALARSGEVARASELVRALPLDCYLCARSRAAVAEARNEGDEAGRLFARAIALGPRLPFAYAEWGEALLRRSDATGALRLFNRALAHGPEFADAHKGRGDALSRLGRDEGAARSYEEAARRAPRWGGLHLRWAWALARLRRADDAREKTCAAAGMDLSRADRVLLTRWMERARLTC